VTAIFVLGFMIGLQHALEADHVAAVASIAARKKSVRSILSHGIVWGLGHTVTLAAFAVLVFFLGVHVDTETANALEIAVGLMLIGLGGHVLYRLWRDRVHFHLHRHAEGVAHMHAHSHRGETGAHQHSDHGHRHPGRFPLRTLLVGMMHGLAGTAALIVLTFSMVGGGVLGLGYVAVFGVGSILGMAALSAVIAVPLARSAKAMTWTNRLLQGVIGTATVALGLGVIWVRMPMAWLS